MSARLNAAFDRLAEILAADCRRSREQLERGQRIARMRRFFGLCQRCGLRPHHGSTKMCSECWVDTGPYDKPIGGSQP